MKFEDNEKLVDWLTRCEAIAESDLFVRSGHPNDQVLILKATLLRAAADGVDWRELYRSIYERWHTERPHFPDVDTMAAEIERHRSQGLNGVTPRFSSHEQPNHTNQTDNTD